MTPPTHDPGRMLSQALSLLVEMVRPIIRDEIRSALAERAPLAECEAPSYLDTATAAKLALCSTKHLERLARAGTVKSYRCGRSLRFKRDDIAAYVEGKS